MGQPAAAPEARDLRRFGGFRFFGGQSIARTSPLVMRSTALRLSPSGRSFPTSQWWTHDGSHPIASARRFWVQSLRTIQSHSAFRGAFRSRVAIGHNLAILMPQSQPQSTGVEGNPRKCLRLGMQARRLSDEESTRVRDALGRLLMKYKTQRELGRVLGYDPTTISKVLTDEQRPGREFAAAVATAIGVPPDDFLAGYHVRTTADRLDSIEERQGRIFELLTEVLDRLEALAPDGDGDGAAVGIGGLEVERPALAGGREGQQDAAHHGQVPPPRRLHAKVTRPHRARKAKP